MRDRTIPIIVGIVLAFAFATIALAVHAEIQKEIKFAESGLQQCLEINGWSQRVVWKRECP